MNIAVLNHWKYWHENRTVNVINFEFDMDYKYVALTILNLSFEITWGAWWHD